MLSIKLPYTVGLLPIRRILTLVVISNLLLVGACKKDNPAPQPTEAERVTTLLTAAKWVPSSSTGWITVDGVDASDLFVGFTMTFTNTGYTTTASPPESPVWPRTDTWRFVTGSTDSFVRDSDGLIITIVKVDDTSLSLSLQWDQETYEGGRSQSLAGKYVFTFSH